MLQEKSNELLIIIDSDCEFEAQNEDNEQDRQVVEIDKLRMEVQLLKEEIMLLNEVNEELSLRCGQYRIAMTQPGLHGGSNSTQPGLLGGSNSTQPGLHGGSNSR